MIDQFSNLIASHNQLGKAVSIDWKTVKTDRFVLSIIIWVEKRRKRKRNLSHTNPEVDLKSGFKCFSRIQKGRRFSFFGWL